MSHLLIQECKVSSYYIAIPNAKNSIAALRGYGYSLEASIADLVDNSIAAKAKKIQIEFWLTTSNEAVVCVADDGVGLTKERLREATNLFSSDPDVRRQEEDLGKFGQGLKTASFAYAKRLSVYTRTAKAIIEAHLDLDVWARHNEYRIYPQNDPELNFQDTEILQKVGHLLPNGHGTVIVWTKCDRLPFVDASDRERQIGMLTLAKAVDQTLGLTFHRFLESGQVEIFVNGNSVKSWSPTNLGTHELDPSEEQEYVVQESNTKLKTYNFAKPDENSKELNFASGFKGLIGHQGVYLYRKNRLIQFGNWFGLSKVEDKHSLARATLDVDEHMDELFHLNVAKFSAQLPNFFLSKIKVPIKNALAASEKAFARKRAKTVDTEKSTKKSKIPDKVWLIDFDAKDAPFRINLSHPFVAEWAAKYGKEFTSLIKLLSISFPTRELVDLANSNPDNKGLDIRLVAEDVIPLARDYLEILLQNQTYSSQAAIAEITKSEPFSKFKQEIEEALHDNL